MRVVVNIYIGIMLLVFFTAGAVVTKRLDTLHHTSEQVVTTLKSDRLR